MTSQPVRAYVVIACKQVFDHAREQATRRQRVLRKTGFTEGESIEARAQALHRAARPLSARLGRASMACGAQ